MSNSPAPSDALSPNTLTQAHLHRHSCTISRRRCARGLVLLSTNGLAPFAPRHPKVEGARERRVFDTPAASCANESEHTSVVTTVAPVRPAFPHAVVFRLASRSPRRTVETCHRRLRGTFLPSVEGEKGRPDFAGPRDLGRRGASFAERLPVPTPEAAAWFVSRRIVPSRFSGP